VLPERMHVVAPGNGFTPESFRVSDYLAYYRLVRNRLADFVQRNDGPQDTYPEPVPQCDLCRWWPQCDRQWRADDHLSLVAGISKLQRRELSSIGIRTLAALAVRPLPITPRPNRGAPDGYTRVREQARVQLLGRERRAPVHELLLREPGRGLGRLPAPSAGDMFFDIEGDPFVGTQGREFLLGWVVLDASGAPEYRHRWATTAVEERDAFVSFIDEVMQRWDRHPDLHIFHYAHYEPGAIKRLMGRYATREADVDRMLRAELFVDLHAITRQALRASVERYSIKDLEQFYGYRRDVDLRTASKNMHAFQRALELDHVDTVPADVRNAVLSYNRDDCVSTLRLRDWLEGLRAELVDAGENVARPTPVDGAPSEAIDERQQRVQALMDRLVVAVPVAPEERSTAQHARWLLAHMLDWHRREDKCAWWEYFRLAGLGDEELLEEKSALAGLVFAATVDGGTVRCPIHRYRFPAQDCDIREDHELHLPGRKEFGTVHAIDVRARTIDIKKRGAMADVHPTAVFAHRRVDPKQLADSLFRLGEWVAEHEVDAPGPHRAARDLLLRIAPRLHGGPASGALEGAGESTLMAARRLALELDGGVLPIQGPPGAGKTHTGARMICELVRAGKKVGITAVSHKVIRNLLERAVEAATEEGLRLECIQKVGEDPASDEDRPIRETNDNGQIVDALRDGSAQVAAGTAWLWARQELFESVDTLFVDEAGQMSLANVLAVAHAARNVVLLGDPQQLDQPLQGSHPEGTEVSALQHLLGAAQTIQPERGLFLGETWRLHPAICALTSELFYEGRLASRPDLARQELRGATAFAGAGLWFVPVEHEGNQGSSAEEVERVASLCAELLSPGVTWIDRHGAEKPMVENDVLIITPYNAQVSALGERLPSARIGTVDKFQGQEAPVVIYSMATSSPEEAPRGMEFLYSLNRLNVATSRARSTCILVANPRLFDPGCRTPRQMRLANAFCRYLEMARVV
jgi:uncharacterized protein